MRTAFPHARRTVLRTHADDFYLGTGRYGRGDAFGTWGLLFLLLLVCTSVGIQLILKGVFRPLHKLLDWLHCIQPGKEVPALENPTKIREFRQLSEAAVDMGNRSYKAYEEQKEFIENASHELRTPLAIVRGKVELLAESDNLSEQQMKELDEIYSTLGRAVKAEQVLVAAFPYREMGNIRNWKMSVDEILDNLLPDLMDIYEHKQVRLVREKARAAPGDSLQPFAGTDSCLQSGEECLASQRGWGRGCGYSPLRCR